MLCLPSNLQSVLVMMTDRHLGNTVVSLPVINALCSYFQHGADVLVDERFADLTRCLPGVKQVIGYPSQASKRRGLLANLRPAGALIAQPLRRYQAVIDLGGGKRSAWLCRASLAKWRVGLEHKGRKPLPGAYTTRIDRKATLHAFEQYAQVLSVIGQHTLPDALVISAGDKAAKQVQQLCSQYLPGCQGPFAVIHPGAGYAYRQWPTDRFALMADWLIEKHHMRVCLIGAPSEKKLMQTVHQQMRYRAQAACLSLNLLQLLALFEQASILLSNESGPTHLAAMTHLPIATIFGPTQEAIWKPRRNKNLVVLRGDVCLPHCSATRCDKQRQCITGVTLADMQQAVMHLGLSHQSQNLAPLAGTLTD